MDNTNNSSKGCVKTLLVEQAVAYAGNSTECWMTKGTNGSGGSKHLGVIRMPAMVLSGSWEVVAGIVVCQILVAHTQRHSNI
jgi:hypothetical protein